MDVTNKLVIRKTAMYIAKNIYINVGHNLNFDDVDISGVFDTTRCEITDNIVMASIKYLINKGYIITNSISTKSLSGQLTVNGIDWVEDCHKVSYANF